MDLEASASDFGLFSVSVSALKIEESTQLIRLLGARAVELPPPASLLRFLSY